MVKIYRNMKGQFLVASALLIAILFISVSSLLTSTSITDVKLLKDDFRKDAMAIISNFRGALSLALAEVSKELELRSSMYNYNNYTTTNEYNESKLDGEKMMVSWHNTILQQYAGRSIRLNITDSVYDCNWNSSEYYSKASANMTLDILTYGFYGLKQNMTSELRLQIISRKENSNKMAYTIKLQKEKGLPVIDLNPSFVKVLYLKNDNTSFAEADPSTIGVTYLGSGIYNVTFSVSNYTSPARIKMILRDGRGIVVAAITKGGVLISDVEDEVGPITTNVLANPNPCPKQSTTKLTATVDDTLTGTNIIFSAEYLINNKITNTTVSEGYMTLSDGYPDSPKESFKADISGLAPGNYTIYVHGMDAVGNWGSFSSIVLQVKDEIIDKKMHISDIRVRAIRSRWWSQIHGEAIVTVVDTNGQPVTGAMVYGHWSGSARRVSNWPTGTDGKVTFTSEDVFYWGGWFGGRLTFTFTADNIVKSGWTYDKSANVETSDTAYYP